jgi:4-amino-4-deoxy-L-arabinose transferase-like glycosyltransferase
MPTPSTLRVPRLLWITLALALAIRIGFLARNWNNLDFAGSYLLHAEVARNILNGHWFQINQPHLQAYLEECHKQQRLIDPADVPAPVSEELLPLYNDEGGYGLLLAAIWKITGSERWWYVRILQLLIDIVMCWFVFQIGRKLFGERTGLVAAFMYACFIPGIELVIRPHRDIWVTFLFIFSVYQLVTLRDARGPLIRMLMIGVATGLVAWMRSTVLLFVILLIPLLLVTNPRKEAIHFCAILLAGFVLTFSPLIIRNYLVFDKFMATRGAFWHSFWAGIGQMPNPYNLRDDDNTIIRFARSLDSTALYETDNYEQVLKKEAFRFIGEHPGWYAGSILKRAAVFVAPKVGREVFFQPTLPQHVSGTLNLSFSKIGLLAIDAVFTLFFLAGVWLMRTRWKDLLVLGYPYIYTLVTLAPFYLVGRNIMNVYFVVLLLISSAVVHLWDRYRSPQLSK